jgi:ketosteroid isomerase-like protein
MTRTTAVLISIFLVIGTVITTFCVATATEHKVSDEETIKELEHEWVNAAARNDADAYSRVLADDFVGNWSDGSKTTKSEEVQMLRSGKETYGENEIIEISVRIYGMTAIASGRNRESSVIKGKNATGIYSFTDVFLKRGGHWQIVASQTARPVPYGANCTTAANP